MAKKSADNSTFKTNFTIIFLIVAAFLIGYLVNRVKTLEERFKTNPAPTQAAVDAGQPQKPAELKIKKPNNASDHWRGEKNARYVLVEYSDLECPFCKNFHPTSAQVLSEYKGKVALVYRHYPLSFHANAQKEAEASECVAEMGGNDKFWEFIDKIFEKTTSNGTGFALDALGPLASELGVNQQLFQSCLDSGKYEKKVKDQLAEGAGAGVNATPTSVIYDMQTGKSTSIEGALPYTSVKTTLDSFIK